MTNMLIVASKILLNEPKANVNWIKQVWEEVENHYVTTVGNSCCFFSGFFLSTTYPWHMTLPYGMAYQTKNINRKKNFNSMQMMNWFRACRDDYTRIHHLYVGEKNGSIKICLDEAHCKRTQKNRSGAQMKQREKERCMQIRTPSRLFCW